LRARRECFGAGNLAKKKQNRDRSRTPAELKRGELTTQPRRRSRLRPRLPPIIEDRSVIKVFRRSFVAGLLSLGLALVSSPHAAQAQTQAQTQGTDTILVLDASGSMWG
jgi:Mg-chelatase subunit ChlD